MIVITPILSEVGVLILRIVGFLIPIDSNFSFNESKLISGKALCSTKVDLFIVLIDSLSSSLFEFEFCSFLKFFLS